MPEGPTLHKLAEDLDALFGGDIVAASSPQGRFAEGAAVLDGTTLERAEAYGKHLFVRFAGDVHLHVHLGLYGGFTLAEGEAPAPRGQVRLRLVGPRGYGDLRGPTRCVLLTPAERTEVVQRLGPDPLRRGASAAAAFDRISRSSRSVAGLLMDQQVLAGVGNVYRAEILFRHGVDPFLEGRSLPQETWEEMWADLKLLMRDAVGKGRIDTTRPEHSPEAMGRPPREDPHGGDVYVYRRAGLDCLVCGTEVRKAELEARNLFWCPTCQPPGARHRP